MWFMSCEVKFMAVDSASFHPSEPETGDVPLEVGVGARDRSLGNGWARGAQLSVYIVRRGIS